MTSAHEATHNIKSRDGVIKLLSRKEKIWSISMWSRRNLNNLTFDTSLRNEPPLFGGGERAQQDSKTMWLAHDGINGSMEGGGNACRTWNTPNWPSSCEVVRQVWIDRKFLTQKIYNVSGVRASSGCLEWVKGAIARISYSSWFGSVVDRRAARETLVTLSVLCLSAGVYGRG